jgi:SAM-dependent methyltransferase
VTLQEQFGQIDIYLFDQILRGNITQGMRVVDAGCGGGRNLVYLLREGYEVFGVDSDAAAVEGVRQMAGRLAPGLPSTNFQVAGVEAMPFPDEFADVVVCHSVLHFARDEAQFGAMVRGLWRVLKPGGMLFCRLGTFIEDCSGIKFEPVGPRRYRMSHGAEWFLADEAMLMELTRRLGGELVDPLKMTVVQSQRCLTTWVVRKGAVGRPRTEAWMSGLR